MSDTTFVVRGDRIVTPGGVIAGAVYVREGRIEHVAPTRDVPCGRRVVDATGLVVLPGLVDTHVHVNEPGRTEWEGFETATRAAAAGGVTTILDMPLNSVPATTTVAALEAKREAARGKCVVDVEFIGGVVPGNAGELAALHAAGVRAFKCFLVPSGVPEFEAVAEADLRKALPVLAAVDAVLMVHAELPGPIADALPGPAADRRRYATYLASRPAAAEHEAVALMCRLAAKAAARVHIVHVSSGDTAGLLRAWRARGARRVTAETCPHYLVFDAEAIPDGATEFKCAPPIRGRANREALWDALLAGDIQTIVSDHSPCPPAMKERGAGDFLAAWGGIASLQLGLPAVWTEMRARGLPLDLLARWMCDAPARLAGLAAKGRIAAGCDADLVLLDPDAEQVIDSSILFHRHPVTPYAGWTLRGVVRATYARGRLVHDGRVPPADAPTAERRP